MLSVIIGPNASGKTSLVRREMILHPSSTTRYISFQDRYGGSTDRDYYVQQRWNSTDIQDPRILLSSGELRKYRLRSVLATSPRKLYIDNPYIGLDSSSRREFQEALESLSREMDIVLVVSREEEVPSCASEVRTLPPVREPHVLTGELAEGILSHRGEVEPSESEVVALLRNVSIRYGERTILRDLDWEVRKGSRWALTGPNGSGKSTLLSLLTADNPQAYACDISMFGVRRGRGDCIWDVKKRIGYVSPELHRSFNDDRDVLYMVSSGASLTGGLYARPTERNREDAMLWMKVLGIDHLAKRSYLSLSSSEQRLTLLARALLRDPELLILDEPMHGLDESNRSLVKEVLRTFCSKKDKTLLMVSHYAEEFPDDIITDRMELTRNE